MKLPKLSGSVLVALGIALSRLAGLLRERLLSRLFGLGVVADAIYAASQVPNLLMMLLGEGVLSASFVPVYSKLLEDEDPKEASRLAAAIGALLLAATGIIVAIFVFAARPITSLLAFGLSGEKFELVVDLVQIMALGMGFLVMSAWCLGVLTSHRRFFLPYVAPVIWNACQIVAIYFMWVRGWDLVTAAKGLAIAAVVGAFAQICIQLPTVLRLARIVGTRFSFRSRWVALVTKRFFPAVIGRGIVQISAYVDLMLAALLATGAIAALIKAQLLYTLPISLFAMSVAAAELPELSRLTNNHQRLAMRSQRSLAQITFWMFFSSLALIVGGDLIISLLFVGGEFDSADAALVWYVLIAYALGLPAIGAGRLLKNVCYALGNTKGPARLAALRLLVSTAVAVCIMFSLDRLVVGQDGISRTDGWLFFSPLAEGLREIEGPVRLGAVGLAVASAVGAWVELGFLATMCRRQIASFAKPLRVLYKPAVAAIGAALLSLVIRVPVADATLWISMPVVAAAATLSYVLIGKLIGLGEVRLLLSPATKTWQFATSRKSKH